jgi:hypothetical protein
LLRFARPEQRLQSARTGHSPRRAKFGQEQSLKAVALILEQLIAKAPEKEARHAT